MNTSDTTPPQPAPDASNAESPPPSPRHREEVLVATLGLRPAVVTTALDLLMADGRVIDEVVVVHTVPPSLEDGTEPDALAAVRALFPDGKSYVHPRRTVPCRLRTVALTRDDQPIPDVRSRGDADAAFRALYSAVRDIKQDGRVAHLCIAGGRKSMMIYGMAVAQLLFDADDRLWHIVGDDAFKHSGRLHPNSRDEAQLVPIPVLSVGLCLVGPVAELLTADDPVSAIEEQRQRMELARRRKCHAFLFDELTDAERRMVLYLLRAVVEERRSPTYSAIARELVLSTSAVRNRLSTIYQKMAAFFELSDVANDNRLLIGLLAPHYRHLAA